MNDATLPPTTALTQAEGHLGRLNSQAVAMRAVLVHLLQDVVRADSLLENHQATQLLEANQQLLVSALGALTEAETANGALDEVVRVVGLDALTGLPNRTLLLDRFEIAIANAKRYGNRVALLFLDLDGFKQINDSFGHETGDDALQWVAACLNGLVREADTVSRHGGDEFLMLLADVAQVADAALVADKVNAALGAHGHIGKHPVCLTASIGISVYPEDGQDAKTLIGHADAAMYAAKKQAKGGVVLRSAASAGPDSSSAPPFRSQRRSILSGPMTADHEQQQELLKEANENLVLAALGAHELLAAAEDAKRRKSELLALALNELNDPFAPIRLAASTLGITGADKTLLPRVQAVIDQQVDKMSRMVSELLDDKQASSTRR